MMWLELATVAVVVALMVHVRRLQRIRSYALARVKSARYLYQLSIDASLSDLAAVRKELTAALQERDLFAQELSKRGITVEDVYLQDIIDRLNESGVIGDQKS